MAMYQSHKISRSIRQLCGGSALMTCQSAGGSALMPGQSAGECASLSGQMKPADHWQDSALY